MSDRLTKFNAETGEYEYKERSKTQEEFNAQRKAVIQRLGHYEDMSDTFLASLTKSQVEYLLNLPQKQKLPELCLLETKGETQ
jgi:hypothetical protein